ncbi:hypothetical protein GRF61_00155 [Azoarcus sp. TTM-91]|uniref:hypothetical protein n=1 Tax=Azoarcus sp. TTM-91 TaxID=2691581 RepID=UPI00145CB82E|nr:hypothetical protein [Azoarcus sp. TTM-91]NMG32861.1 hypothetical protein [Azoarcus sp. TTM-91]
MLSISDYLESEGPHLTSEVASWLTTQGISSDAARKRLSRKQPPVRTFPVPLFPKGAGFIYLEKQRKEERFWQALHNALRTTGSVYGIALDGVLARRGAVSRQEFSVISGATERPVKKQVTAETALERLVSAGLLSINLDNNDQSIVAIARAEIGYADIDGIRARGIAEGVILDGLREWAKNIGTASYNQIRIRGEEGLEPIQQFKFDLAGPSYLLPLRRGTKGNRPLGFMVADVFSEGILDEHQVRYFIRKAHALHATLTGGSVFPILVADGFTGPALTTGHAAGIMMATPSRLFGRAVGDGLKSLVQTLNRAASYASADSPERLTRLVSSLSEIEGRARNLRGPLFELLAAYLVRRDSVSISMGVRAKDPGSGKQADIDVLKVAAMNAECTAIECKGKEPGGFITDEDVRVWLGKVAVMQAYLRTQERFSEATISFELWTSGTFTEEALQLLHAEQKRRTKFPIRWKNGQDVLAVANRFKEKAVADTLQQHFLRHPLSVS